MSHAPNAAVVVHAPGGPEVLRLEPRALVEPGPGEVQLRHTAIGLNYIDVYHRTGLYPLPCPFVPGQEAVGVVTALGPDVSGLRVGQRVGYVGLGGAYAQARNAPADRLLPIPDELDDVAAASVLLKGMTAEFLVRRCRPVGLGDTVVFHAAAGGVGVLATQWARHLGATVIGVVGGRAKVAVAAAHCHHVVALDAEPLVETVLRLTAGRGADVVYDSVGRDTFERSLACLAPRGMLVSFGQSSGKPPLLDVTEALGGARSLFVTRPSLFAYVATRAELEASAAALFSVLSEGTVRVPAATVLPLADVAAAHRALEARQTTGPVVLVPEVRSILSGT